MNDFIRDLCFYYTERMDTPKSQPYQKALEEVLQLEEEIKNQVGHELLDRYQCVVDDLYDVQFDEIFLRGIQFGVQFMLAVFPQSSNTTSTL